MALTRGSSLISLQEEHPLVIGLKDPDIQYGRTLRQANCAVALVDSPSTNMTSFKLRMDKVSQALMRIPKHAIILAGGDGGGEGSSLPDAHTELRGEHFPFILGTRSVRENVRATTYSKLGNFNLTIAMLQTRQYQSTTLFHRICSPSGNFTSVSIYGKLVL